jgi:hypothetical protein
MFSDFSELLALPLPVQKQLLSALVGIAEEPKWRKAEACYALSVFYILRIGTIRPNDPENLRGGFTGYHLDAGTSLKWLKKAARLGSRMLRAADRQVSLIVEALLDLSSYLKNKQILIDSGCLGRSAGA